MIWLAAVGLAAAIPNYAAFRFSDKTIDAFQSGAFKRCMDRSGGVTSNMRDCSEVEGKRIDALLNQEYRGAMARLMPAKRIVLRNQQRQWLKTRDQECLRKAKPDEGGTIWLLIMDDCGLSEDIRRTLWLRTVGR
jgi:uncharacterized protein YecT (DUF1311 family)